MSRTLRSFVTLLPVVFSLSLLSANQSYAGSYSGAAVNETYVVSDGSVYVGLNVQPTNTCSFYGWYFRFDGSTTGGKNMLSTVLAAKLAGKNVAVWYNDSTSPNTNQNNGCNYTTMAVLTGISIP